MRKRPKLLPLFFLIVVIFWCAAPPVQAVKTTATGSCAPDQEQYIWSYFMDLTNNPHATAGIVGNLFFESHLLPDNLETFGKAPAVKQGLTYTEAVDQDVYSGFISDGFGYGLAQWTYPGRKQKLLDLAKFMGQSVGSLDVQLALVAQELEEFNMLDRLQSTDSVKFASDYIMMHFENPRDQSPAKKLERVKVCQEFYTKYADSSLSDLSPLQRKVVTIAKYSEDYNIPAEAGYCQAWANGVYLAAGLANDNSNSASMSAGRFCVSDDFSDIPAGAAVYGHSSSEYGHVGIYVGNGQVYHNVGGVVVDSLEDWIMFYDGFAWGWIGGNNLLGSTETSAA